MKEELIFPNPGEALREAIDVDESSAWGSMRGRHCGKYTLQGVALNGRETKFVRMNCKCWNCRYCGPRLAAQYKAAIRATAEALQLRRFLTLTLDPKKLSAAQLAKPVPYLRECFNKFRTYLRRQYGEAPKYIAVLEFQANGLPHLHILIDRFIAQRWIKDVWSRIGGGMHVDIRFVDLHRVSHYLAKYLTKELLMSAPKKTRRVTVARGISLRTKRKKDHLWQVLYGSIFGQLRKFLLMARNIEFDQEAVLCGFSIEGVPINLREAL